MGTRTTGVDLNSKVKNLNNMHGDYLEQRISQTTLLVNEKHTFSPIKQKLKPGHSRTQT